MTDGAALYQPKDFFLLLRLRKSARVAFDPLGFTLHKAVLLFQIENGVQRHEEFAALLDVRDVAISAMVTKLARQHLVVRSYNLKDGRRVELRLTVEGCVAVSELRQAWDTQMAIEP